MEIGGKLISYAPIYLSFLFFNGLKTFEQGPLCKFSFFVFSVYSYFS